VSEKLKTVSAGANNLHPAVFYEANEKVSL
jgi:hypothetical protein